MQRFEEKVVADARDLSNVFQDECFDAVVEKGQAIAKKAKNRSRAATGGYLYRVKRDDSVI